MDIQIRTVDPDEIYANRALIDDYAAECAIPEMGQHDPQLGVYRNMVDMGSMHMLGAFDGDRLVGFAIVVLAIVPHFGRFLAATESLFVASDARSSGAGLALIRAVEDMAQSRGAVGVTISAQAGSRLERVMDGQDYRRSNVVFFKGLM